jgi:hypothetical protein
MSFSNGCQAALRPRGAYCDRCGSSALGDVRHGQWPRTTRFDESPLGVLKALGVPSLSISSIAALMCFGPRPSTLSLNVIRTPSRDWRRASSEFAISTGTLLAEAHLGCQCL